MEQFISKAKDIMNYVDRVLAIIMLGAMLAVMPLYASAALATAHQRVERVPVMGRISAKLLADTLTPARGVVLKPMSMRVPAPLPFKIRK